MRLAAMQAITRYAIETTPNNCHSLQVMDFVSRDKCFQSHPDPFFDVAEAHPWHILFCSEVLEEGGRLEWDIEYPQNLDL